MESLFLFVPSALAYLASLPWWVGGIFVLCMTIPGIIRFIVAMRANPSRDAPPLFCQEVLLPLALGTGILLMLTVLPAVLAG